MNLSQIPFQRVILYFMLLCLLPFLGVLVNFYSEKDKLDTLESQLEDVQFKAMTKLKRQSTNLKVRNHFKDADHFYIDKHVETLSFLEPEIDALQKIVSHKNFPDDESIKKRLDHLTGPGNALVFTEGVVQTLPYFQETTETQTHPVEVDVQDIRKILARIEGVNMEKYKPGPHRPQLIITDFKLDKKKLNERSEVYILNMKLIKREFL